MEYSSSLIRDMCEPITLLIDQIEQINELIKVTFHMLERLPNKIADIIHSDVVNSAMRGENE